MTPGVCRLLFNDAATFDADTQTGGMNGSVVTKEELGRPENKGLDALVKRIAKAKEAIDAGNAEIGSGPLSWADTIVLAVKVAVQDEWRDIKLSRASDTAGGDQIVKAFGSAWDVRLGRLDAKQADPAGRVLAPGASAEEMRTYMLKLAAKPTDGGAFKPKQPFWERPAFVVYPATQDDPLVRGCGRSAFALACRKKMMRCIQTLAVCSQAYESKIASENDAFRELKRVYDRERKTTTRTTYEVDFIKNFTRLSELGAKFDNSAYLHSVSGYRLQ